MKDAYKCGGGSRRRWSENGEVCPKGTLDRHKAALDVLRELVGWALGLDSIRRLGGTIQPAEWLRLKTSAKAARAVLDAAGE